MTTPTTADLLKYSNLQMAAEAFLVADPITGALKTDIKTALKEGNNHSSKFTEIQAQAFVDQWEVVAQKANTSTGFSGTLFRNRANPSELVMSFRSTEFIDDAARDNQATNVLEIKDHGYAFGQIRDMEVWYSELKTAGKLPAGQTFDVTGYSLGGHLATAFNILHGANAPAADKALIGQVVTFNGAGVGGVLSGTTLKQVIDQFTTLSTSSTPQAFGITDPTLAALYVRARAEIAAGRTISAGDKATLNTLRSASPEGPPIDGLVVHQAQMIWDADSRIAGIRTEVGRLNEGTDLVQAGVTYTLSANVENLTLTGAAAINGTGNALDNVILGTSAVNTLIGGDGNDTLNGGAGADILNGGLGDDIYMVDNPGDVVTEAADAGIDQVQSVATYTLGANLENLTLLGSGAINATGNALNNVVAGNAANNVLTGGLGADTLVGGAGSDTYRFDRGDGADIVSENDTRPATTDVALFGTGIATDQLWFRQTGNDLEVSIIGTADKVNVSNWYLGTQYHVEQFKTSDGHTLLDSQVQNLVQAMASFAPPAAGQTTLPANYASSLAPTLAANWQ